MVTELNTEGLRFDFRRVALKYTLDLTFEKLVLRSKRVGEECLRVVVKVPHREGCMFKKHNKHMVFSFVLTFERADVRTNRFAGFLFLINGSQFLFFSFHRNWSCYPWKLGVDSSPLAIWEKTAVSKYFNPCKASAVRNGTTSGEITVLVVLLFVATMLAICSPGVGLESSVSDVIDEIAEIFKVP